MIMAVEKEAGNTEFEKIQKERLDQTWQEWATTFKYQGKMATGRHEIKRGTKRKVHEFQVPTGWQQKLKFQDLDTVAKSKFWQIVGRISRPGK